MATNAPTTETRASFENAVQAVQKNGSPRRKAGNKPIETFRSSGCAVSLFQNERKATDGSPKRDYRFTLSRRVKEDDAFKTVYSFRRKDAETLRALLADADSFVDVHESFLRNHVDRATSGSEAANVIGN